MNRFDHTNFLKSLTSQPGIYQMFDDNGKVIYVGKAKQLKARVSSYFRDKQKGGKAQLLVSKIADIQVTVTHNETEALLLEHTLIKKHHPRFNIVFRDDKSYPYLKLSEHSDFPSLTAYRGKRRKSERYFGPYTSGYAMQETLQLLQKLFKLRSCRDSFFRNRTRPCLQYQIKRCKAPCVGLVSRKEYQRDVKYASDFLMGRNQAITRDLTRQMKSAVRHLNYEKAAEYRDLIQHLKKVQTKQSAVTNQRDTNIVAVTGEGVNYCIAQLQIRQGKLGASQTYFPKVQGGALAHDVLRAFISQTYLGDVGNGDGAQLPYEIIVNEVFESMLDLAAMLSTQSTHQVLIKKAQRGDKLRWQHLALTNAQQALQQRLSNRANYQKRLEALQHLLQREQLPGRMECFDISHHQGEATVASCVVFNEEGAQKNAYRHFNIDGVAAGDDYAAMEQALTRRYRRLQKEVVQLPDVLLIDGGKGQLSRARDVLLHLGLDAISLVGLAKGVARKESLETLFVYMNNEFQPYEINEFPLAASLLQQIRNEAHRFAMSGHRQARKKRRKSSVLEQIEGVGPKRRRELLNYFGGLQGLKQASVTEIARVPVINRALAERIYSALQSTLL